MLGQARARADVGDNTAEFPKLGNPTGRFKRRPIIFYLLLKATPAQFVGGKEILGGLSVRPRG
jgi:hypothetical protein